jgi:hypothetical protein
MLVSARHAHAITALVGAILIVAACKKADDKPADKSAKSDDKTGSATPGSAAPGSIAPAPPARDVATAPARPAKTTLAKRCVLGGDPLVSDCVGGGEGIAFGTDGTLFVVDGQQVRRYQRAGGTECRFEPAGEPIALPPDNPRPHPVYMRSGGPAWHLAHGGDAIYAHDYLGGLFRIDRGKPEPTCDDVFGFKTVAALGKRLLVARNGIEELKPGATCKAVSAKLDDKARGDLYTAHDKLYLASGADLARYDGATPTKLGEGTRICYVTGFTACGDGACAIDSNCMQLIQLGADGKVLRVLDDDKLFATRPWSLAEATTSDAGDVYVLARHRDKLAGAASAASDKSGEKEICEAAIYELPAAAFAL